jgi:hypothetical protein
MRLLHREPETDESEARVDERTDDGRPRERTGFFGRRTTTTDAPATDTPTTEADRPRERTGIFGRRTTTDAPATDADRDRTVERRPVATRRVRRERAHRPYHFGSVLAIAGGAALAVIGIVALLRGDLNESWDEPVTTVLRIDHTPLLAAIEVAAGALLVLFGLIRWRFMALFGAVALAVAAAVAAIQPGRLATQYALETWWAWTVAGAAAFIALVMLLPSGRRRVVEEPETT